MTRRVSIADNNTLRDLWASPATRAEIAAVLGISEQGVSERVRRLGLPPRRLGKRPVPAAEDATLRDLWASPATLAEIASVFGISEWGVRGRARRLGLPPRRGVSRAADDALRALWATPATRAEIAAVLGTSESAISWRARRLRLPPRKSSPCVPGDADDALRALWPTRATHAEIAAVLGISKSAVRYRALRLGLPPRRQRRPATI